jgi:hypothetical protein
MAAHHENHPVAEVDEWIQRLYTDEEFLLRTPSVSTSVPVSVSAVSVDEEENRVLKLAKALQDRTVVVRRLFISNYEHRHNSAGLSLHCAEAIGEALRVNSSLTCLEVDWEQAHLSTLLEGVSASHTITALELQSCGVVRPQDLKGLVRIQRLSIQDAIFRNGGAAMLQTASSLQELLLADCGLDSNGAAEVAKLLETNTSLQALTLTDNPIGDQGATVLAEALSSRSRSRSSTLTSLQLDGCSIGTIGAVALAAMLEKNNRLENLNILINLDIAAKGKRALVMALNCNTSLLDMDMNLRGLDRSVQHHINHNLTMNAFRRNYVSWNGAPIAPFLYPLILWRVSEKPSLLFLFLQENRDMFIPHLPEHSAPVPVQPTMRKRKANDEQENEEEEQEQEEEVRPVPVLELLAADSDDETAASENTSSEKEEHEPLYYYSKNRETEEQEVSSASSSSSSLEEHHLASDSDGESDGDSSDGSGSGIEEQAAYQFQGSVHNDEQEYY